MAVSKCLCIDSWRVGKPLCTSVSATISSGLRVCVCVVCVCVNVDHVPSSSIWRQLISELGGGGGQQCFFQLVGTQCVLLVPGGGASHSWIIKNHMWFMAGSTLTSVPSGQPADGHPNRAKYFPAFALVFVAPFFSSNLFRVFSLGSSIFFFLSNLRLWIHANGKQVLQDNSPTLHLLCLFTFFSHTAI